MTATEFETDEALAEGIKIKWLRSIKAIHGTISRRSDEARRERPAAADRTGGDAPGGRRGSRCRTGTRTAASLTRLRRFSRA